MAGLLGRLFRRRREELRCSAVVPAAGAPSRMGKDKLLLPLGEQPVLLHTLRAWCLSYTRDCGGTRES